MPGRTTKPRRFSMYINGMSLKNRTAVISGAGGEVAAVLARNLAAQGANLALLGRNPEKLEALRSALALPEARALVQEADLSEPDAAGSAAAGGAGKDGGGGARAPRAR